jgi:hypothetical protein
LSVFALLVPESLKATKQTFAGYQYSEGSMPHDVSDDSGEVGQLSFEAVDGDDSKSILLYRDRVELEDNLYGFITGSVNNFQYSDGFVNVTGSSRLNLINTEGVIGAVTTVAQYLRNIFDTASITSDVIIAPSVPTTPIVTPTFEGNFWVLLKQFASLHQLDVSLIRNTIYVRPMREREISIENVTSQNVVTLSEETFFRKTFRLLTTIMNNWKTFLLSRLVGGRPMLKCILLKQTKQSFLTYQLTLF